MSALILGMLPCALAAEEDGNQNGSGQGKKLTVNMAAEQAFQSVIIVSAYSEDGRMVSSVVRQVDLQAGENSVPLDLPSGGTYGRAFFLDTEMRPLHDAIDLGALPGPQDPEDPSGPQDPGDPSGPQDPKDPSDPQDPGDPSDPQDPEDPPEASGFRYCRTTLTSQEERNAYDRIAEGLLARKEVLEDLPADIDLLNRMIPLILRDYPECFWYFGGGSYSGEIEGETLLKVSMEPEYLYSETEQAELQNRIDAWVEECFAGIPDGASDYDKALHVYRYVIDHADYGTETNNSIVSIMVDGCGVCGSYAKTIQYLLNRLGIDTALITGTVKDESGKVEDHGWNLVWLDGSPCWIDATWGDPVVGGGASNGGPDYTFFGLTSTDIFRSHTLSQDVPVPDCVSEENNYFRRSGLFFETYDEEKLVEVMSNTLSAGERRICMRFSDDVWGEASSRLLNGGELLQFLQEAMEQSGLTGGFSYSFLRQPSYGSLSVCVTILSEQ